MEMRSSFRLGRKCRGGFLSRMLQFLVAVVMVLICNNAKVQVIDWHGDFHADGPSFSGGGAWLLDSIAGLVLGPGLNSGSEADFYSELQLFSNGTTTYYGAVSDPGRVYGPSSGSGPATQTGTMTLDF